MWSLFYFDSFFRNLLSCMIDGIVRSALPVTDQLRDGNDRIPPGNQVLQNPGQGFRGVFCGVVEKNDGPRTYFFRYPLGDLIRGNSFPVQTVISPFGWSKTQALT